MKYEISINGKFFGATGTGVQRVAEEIIAAIDTMLTQQPTIADQFNVEIIAPKNVTVHLKLKNIKVNQSGFLSGFLKNITWEQLNLPLLVKGRTLVSLCNLSSIFVKNAIVMIHDAQVYTTPKSYSFGFRTWYYFLFPILGKISKKIITVSEFSKSELVKYGIAKAEKIEVIHNGCNHVLKTPTDENILAKLQLTPQSYCITQANTQTHKNIQILLKAFFADELQNTKLVLYGNANQQAFENKGMTVSKNVVFTGRINDSELKTLYENALATLTPSLTEGFGLQPLEGMILGTPAIVAPCGALPEVCGDVGLYADPHKPEAWVNAIVLLNKYPNLTAELKSKVKIHAEKLTWEKSAEHLLRFILEKK